MLQGLFWKEEMELCVLGIQNAGKSSFVNVVNTGNFEENMIPTVGFNMHKVERGKVTIKVWDMGGQRKFRAMWERYCRGVSVIVFVIDAADEKSFPTAFKELNSVLSKPSLAHIPLLLLLNKNDLPGAVHPETIIKELDFASIAANRDVSYFSISCKNVDNIDKTLDWVIKKNRERREQM